MVTGVSSLIRGCFMFLVAVTLFFAICADAPFIKVFWGAAIFIACGWLAVELVFIRRLNLIMQALPKLRHEEGLNSPN